MTPVRFAPEVPDELAEAVLCYEARKKGLGSEFLDEVQASLPFMRSSSSFGKTKCASWQGPTPNVGPSTGCAASDANGTSGASRHTLFRRHPGETPLGLIRPK